MRLFSVHGVGVQTAKVDAFYEDPSRLLPQPLWSVWHAIVHILRLKL